jgi:NodT family efflux transporter outer membrane factor (OMF) lipoprotein
MTAMSIRSLALFPLLLTAACAAGPDYVRPAAPGGEDWMASVDSTQIDPGWWRKLDDPLLGELVEAAVAGNLDLREAEARLREARADRDAAAGRRLPEAAVGASATRNRLSEKGQIPIGNIPGFDGDFSLFDGGFDAAWEIDLWGRNARAVEAADARAEAAVFARRETLMRVIAELVRDYAHLRATQARIESLRTDAGARGEIARLVGQRFRAGEASRFDFLRAEGQASNARAELAGLDAEARAAAYRIALLAGRPPEALVERLLASAPLPRSPGGIGAGLRSDLLLRRPDIGRAERELAAATADVGIATADQFPRLSLLGSIGQQSRSGDDLFSGASTRFSIGPSLHWPIFSGGRVRALLRAADARADAAAARYDRAVLTALSDSETALNRYAAAQAIRGEREAARALAAQSLDLARQRYSAGEDDLIVLLEAQSAASAADARAIDAREAELAALAALYKALGGGWEMFEERDAEVDLAPVRSP